MNQQSKEVNWLCSVNMMIYAVYSLTVYRRVGPVRCTLISMWI